VIAELHGRMVDDAVAGQRPVLHQALHGSLVSCPSSGDFFALFDIK
jgi:hypothetical protein